MTTPDDFDGGPAAMTADMAKAENREKYGPLPPLGQRGSTSVKLSRPQGEDEAAMAMKFGYSQPIAQVSKLSQKMYGYMRDGNIKDDDEKTAIRGSNAINDLILMAPCVTRQERYDEEEMRAQQWIKLIGTGIRGSQFPLDPYEPPPGGDDEDLDGDGEVIRPTGEVRVMPVGHRGPRDDIHRLLEEWGSADAFMLQCRIDEERYGIDYAERHYDEYDRMEELRRDSEMRAARLPPAENMLFWCRVRQYQIMRERAHDLAMGYPINDFTEVKRELSDGKDIHDVAHRMPWAFRVGYDRVLASMMDGEAHRMLLMAMIAGQIPVQQHQLPWGMPPGYWGGPPPSNGQNGQNGQNGPQGNQQGEDQEQDKRPAMFNLFGGGNKQPQNGAQPQQKPPSRRRRGGGAGSDQEALEIRQPNPIGGIDTIHNRRVHRWLWGWHAWSRA